MTRAQVQLNGVYYKLAANTLPVQSLANQMASKVGQGQSKYADLTSWDAWIQQDWSAGVGKLQPHMNPGTLYSEAETRVPNQMILATLPRFTDQRVASGSVLDSRFDPESTTNTFTIGVGQTYTRAAMKFRLLSGAGGSWPTTKENIVWFYCRASVGQVLNFQVLSDDGLHTVLASGSTTVTVDSKGFYWHGCKMTGHASLTATGTYRAVIYPSTGTIELATNTSGYSFGTLLYDGATWTVDASIYVLFATSVSGLDNDSSGTEDSVGFVFFRIGTDLYVSGLVTTAYHWDEGNDLWDNDAITGSTAFIGVRHAVEWNDKAYLAVNAGDNAHSLSTSLVAADLGYEAHCFAREAGYLWRSVGNVPYYTNVAAPTSGDWVTYDEMMVGTPDYPILAMCGVDTNMFCSTAEGLYRIAEGDFAVSVAPWSSTDTRNGLSMVNFQGSLYVTANGRVMRYQEDGTLQDIWIMRDDDLVSGRLGRVLQLCVVNNSVMALASPEAAGGAPTVWAFVNESWHHIATLPYSEQSVLSLGDNLCRMFHDTDTNYLYISTSIGVVYRIYVSESAINPYNDTAVRYQHYSWVEWDWFDSPVFDAEKDYHSVKIFGENMAANCTATVYWKDDDSTGWELLGTSDIDHEDLEWTITGGTRPRTHRFKLGILLRTTTAAETPRIRAVRVKYHLMVRDWFRWSFQVDVSGRTESLQMTADGARHTLTASQIKTNLDNLCRAVPPFVYIDVDGTQWLVKVQDANFTYTKWEYNENTTNSWWEGVYNIVVESVKPETYA